MKPQVPPNIERFRITTGPMRSDRSFGMNGAFVIPYTTNELMVIISDQEGWDHVSVSLKNRCPNWDEMNFIKRLFFDPEETVIQYHPKESQYVNRCKTALHMWRRHGQEYELPSQFMVG